MLCVEMLHAGLATAAGDKEKVRVMWMALAGMMVNAVDAASCCAPLLLDPALPLTWRAGFRRQL